MTVAEAFDYLVQEEESKLIDMDQVTRIATWGSGQPEQADAIESPIDDEMTDVLRSLGYID